MKVQKLDTGVTAIELDPNKKYMFVVDTDAGVEPTTLSMEHGTVIYKKPNTEIALIEQPLPEPTEETALD